MKGRSGKWLRSYCANCALQLGKQGGLKHRQAGHAVVNVCGRVSINGHTGHKASRRFTQDDLEFLAACGVAVAGSVSSFVA